MTIEKLLSGHNSQETAYIIESYPYGRLRCKMRVWIETSPKKGQRFCTQTSNPKKNNEEWNNPKKSTYSDLMVLYIEAETGYVKHDSISIQYDANKLEEFVTKYGSVLTSEYELGAIKSGRYIHLTREAMKNLVKAAGFESGNIYDVQPATKRSEILAQAKADGLVALNKL